MDGCYQIHPPVLPKLLASEELFGIYRASFVNRHFFLFTLCHHLPGFEVKVKGRVKTRGQRLRSNVWHASFNIRGSACQVQQKAIFTSSEEGGPIPDHGLCLCVCNQDAYVDNLVDAVD